MSNNQYVFISYSREDDEVVEKLIRALNAKGVEVWRDIERIFPGENWLEKIEAAIRDSAAIVYLVSRHSANLGWISAEFQAAIRNDKLIVPVIINDTELHRIPVFLREYLWVDLRQGFEQGIVKILEALKGKVAIGPPVRSKGKKSKGYVFFNYAEEDSDFVEKLVSFMEDHGYGYWDYRKSDRDYHTHLFIELEKRINEASVILSILSEEWKSSKWTVREFFFSEEVGKPIFLLKAKPLGPTLAIAGIPYIDFVSDFDQGFSKLEKELRMKNL